jgi:hypothetical protein
VYLAGLAGFTLASLACSLAPGTGALIGARIAQGACTSAQVAAVAGVAACGTVYFALAARPAYAFAVVTATLAANGFAGAACSFLSARRRAAEVPTARSEDRIPARALAMIMEPPRGEGQLGVGSDGLGVGLGG